MRNGESFTTAVCPDYETFLKECRLCQFVSKLGGRDYVSALHAASHARVLV